MATADRSSDSPSYTLLNCIAERMHVISSLKNTANRFRKSVKASLQRRATDKGIERSPEGPAGPAAPQLRCRFAILFPAQVFAVDILCGYHKASSCNADHRSAENDKRQSRYVAEFLAWQRQSATCTGKLQE